MTAVAQLVDVSAWFAETLDEVRGPHRREAVPEVEQTTAIPPVREESAGIPVNLPARRPDPVTDEEHIIGVPLDDTDPLLHRVDQSIHGLFDGTYFSIHGCHVRAIRKAPHDQFCPKCWNVR